MSLWQVIKNAFIPWNLRRSGGGADDGARHVDFGQLLIDGANGDITDITRVIDRERQADAADSGAAHPPASLSPPTA